MYWEAKYVLLLAGVKAEFFFFWWGGGGNIIFFYACNANNLNAVSNTLTQYPQKKGGEEEVELINYSLISHTRSIKVR